MRKRGLENRPILDSVRLQRAALLDALANGLTQAQADEHAKCLGAGGKAPERRAVSELGRDEMIELLLAYGVKVDRRWKDDRLRKAVLEISG